MAIPRTIVNHPIWFDVRNWFRTFRLGSITPAEAEARVRDFEESFSEYYGVRNTIAFPFARTALYASLKSQGFEKGSEVLMPPITIKPMMDVVIAWASSRSSWISSWKRSASIPPSSPMRSRLAPGLR